MLIFICIGFYYFRYVHPISNVMAHKCNGDCEFILLILNLPLEMKCAFFYCKFGNVSGKFIVHLLG